ncbi:SPOR domain-containing protein [Methylotenera sp.]|uniref:SPOR domain-containing protein n=1 Tax=Methylotenera sp. TaxID=2051956 RepID=UPI002717EF3E|nr:SPOR domain-containing protein [Methylotenera sp.]MDO9206033.1 SPOR domain-containing protein [Methylotenera sp.]MDO9394436.1 SPOR domain-containing protein [Methylotenera sp.]MDP1522692.1 SPOR domain-containing protein [Methylotenera sp.]MDP2071873.1 SPOR domain-containing protein [Methylotenera sp.]MDP2230788.1 SPOR domain-containing protein [Methylotenera sp.]
MVAESPNNQELALKKRARRRLVGAIALVLFMVIVLPKILQDRAALAPQESIKITMPDENIVQQIESVDRNATPVESQAEVVALEESINIEGPASSETADEIQTENKKANDKNSATSALVAEAKVAVKSPDIKKDENKSSESKSSEVKVPSIKSESFSIQVGVFSDMANVKQLQARLKQAGLDSRTENISTPKGEKIRLKAGRFNSRQEAAYALTKLQAADLSGMVISNN